MSSSHYTVESITTEDGIASFQEDWNRLSRTAQFSNVFTTYDWFWAWYQRFSRKECVGKLRPHVLMLKKHGAVTGISPLISTTSSRFGISLRRLNFVAHEWDYNDLVVGDDLEGQTTAVMEFLSQTSSEWDVLDFRDLRGAGNAIVHITSALANAGLPYRIFSEDQRCPYMPIDSSWSETMKQHSRYTRRVYQRFVQMNRQGLKVRIVENPQEELQLLEKLIALEAQKHVGGELSSPFVGKYGDVFRSLFDTLGPKGWISVVLLELRDRLAAWMLLYRCGNSLWASLTAYDRELSDLAPGTLLIPTVIDYGFAHGFEEFDFLSGEESYKLRWTSNFRQTYRLLVWNRRRSSRLRALAYLKLRVRNPL
jgi:CelD/BcsL family acetyltransferase involved in cellulose biosynthesis